MNKNVKKLKLVILNQKGNQSHKLIRMKKMISIIMKWRSVRIKAQSDRMKKQMGNHKITMKNLKIKARTTKNRVIKKQNNLTKLIKNSLIKKQISTLIPIFKMSLNSTHN